MNATTDLSGVAPLATTYLPPFLAQRLANVQYMVVGALSALVWDIVVHLESDIRLVREKRMRMMFAVYFVSRVTTLCLTLLQTLAFTVQIPHCRPYTTGIVVCFNIVMASTMLLSFFRVCAVWQMQKSIVAIFGILWILGVAGAATTFVGIEPIFLGDSSYCSFKIGSDLITFAIIAPAAHHLITLLAITYGICHRTSSEIENYKFLQTNYRRFIQGESLPAFSRSVLQVSQICYLVATLAGVIQGIWFYVYRSDPSYRFGVLLVYMVTTNIVFGWVFRQTRLGISNDQNIFAPGSNYSRSPNIRSTLWKEVNLRPEITISKSSDDDMNTADQHAVAINIREVVEYVHDDVAQSDKACSV